MILRLKAEPRGGHVHVDVFVGPDADNLAMSGRLVFSVDEWIVLTTRRRDDVQLDIEDGLSTHPDPLRVVAD